MHSLLATDWMKNRVEALFGRRVRDGLYRFAYNNITYASIGVMVLRFQPLAGSGRVSRTPAVVAADAPGPGHRRVADRRHEPAHGRRSLHGHERRLGVPVRRRAAARSARARTAAGCRRRCRCNDRWGVPRIAAPQQSRSNADRVFAADHGRTAADLRRRGQPVFVSSARYSRSAASAAAYPGAVRRVPRADAVLFPIPDSIARLASDRRPLRRDRDRRRRGGA